MWYGASCVTNLVKQKFDRCVSADLCSVHLSVCLPAGGHHSHGQAGVVEVSETKGEAESVLSAGGKHEHSHEQLHACIGVSLVLGFVFMLLVDQIGSSHVHSTEGVYHRRPSAAHRSGLVSLIKH